MIIYYLNYRITEFIHKKKTISSKDNYLKIETISNLKTTTSLTKTW